MIPILKNTAPGKAIPGGGQDKARRALNSKNIVTHSKCTYNLLDILPAPSDTWTTEDINRVKNAVIGYCLAMAEGDIETMTLAAGMLQRLPKQQGIKAVTAAYNEYAHSDYGTRKP